MSQAELAERVQVDPRHIRRYESGESQPSLPVARGLALALGVTIDELAGGTPLFSGLWWSCWSGLGDAPALGAVDLRHRGRKVEFGPPSLVVDESRGGSAPGGAPPDLVWRGEARADDSSLLGWYVIDAPPHRSKGTFMLAVHPDHLVGTWIRVSFTSGLGTGALVVARTRNDAARLAESQNQP